MDLERGGSPDGGIGASRASPSPSLAVIVDGVLQLVRCVSVAGACLVLSWTLARIRPTVALRPGRSTHRTRGDARNTAQYMGSVLILALTAAFLARALDSHGACASRRRAVGFRRPVSIARACSRRLAVLGVAASISFLHTGLVLAALVGVWARAQPRSPAFSFGLRRVEVVLQFALALFFLFVLLYGVLHTVHALFVREGEGAGPGPRWASLPVALLAAGHLIASARFLPFALDADRRAADGAFGALPSGNVHVKFVHARARQWWEGSLTVDFAAVFGRLATRNAVLVAGGAASVLVGSRTVDTLAALAITALLSARM